MKYFNEYCESGTKEQNDKRALLMWHSIQRAVGKKENELATKTPLYSVVTRNGERSVNVSYTFQ